MGIYSFPYLQLALHRSVKSLQTLLLGSAAGDADMLSVGHSYMDIGFYRDTVVAIRRINRENGVTLTKQDMIEMKAVRSTCSYCNFLSE